MRRRLSAMLLAIIGLGVPLLVALMARRSEENGDSGPGPGSVQPTPDLLRSPQAPTGASATTLAQPRADATQPVLEPHPTGVFAAIGRFDYRFRRILPVVGMALVIGLNIWAAKGSGKLIQGGWFIPGSQEQQEA